jgi:hypothetical protein
VRSGQLTEVGPASRERCGSHGALRHRLEILSFMREADWKRLSNWRKINPFRGHERRPFGTDGPRVDFRYASLATNLAWQHDMSCRAKSLIPKRGVGVELASDYKCMSGMSRHCLGEPLAESRHLGDPADRTLAAFQEHRLRGNVPHCCQCANHCQVEDTRNACE